MNTRSHVQQMYARATRRRKTGTRPSFLTLIVFLLLLSGSILIGLGIMALILAPFALLTGSFLLLFTLSLICLISIGKAGLSIGRWLLRQFYRTSVGSYLGTSFFQFRVLFVRLLVFWLERWLEYVDPGSTTPGASSTSSHYTRVMPQLKGV